MGFDAEETYKEKINVFHKVYGGFSMVFIGAVCIVRVKCLSCDFLYVWLI